MCGVDINRQSTVSIATAEISIVIITGEMREQPPIRNTRPLKLMRSATAIEAARSAMITQAAIVLPVRRQSVSNNKSR